MRTGPGSAWIRIKSSAAWLYIAFFSLLSEDMLLADALLQPETSTVLNRPLISAMLQHKHRQQAELSGRSWDNQWNRDNEGSAALGQKKERKKNHSTHWPCDGFSSEYHLSCFFQPCSSLFYLLVVVCECRRTLVCRLFRENRYVKPENSSNCRNPFKNEFNNPVTLHHCMINGSAISAACLHITLQ